ncbi:MAG: 30S ribosomal protein S8 [Spirochaetaceae bacterium]|nr:30S ribosomal protein S8 [Spirochaetaceae bacterium]|tara:strand:- start:32198 stop:32593 length:396 start_codon:yes stop_codon:yes gene_type:complete
MSLSDPIADMLTRIRNASRAGHPKVSFAGSNLKESIVSILKNEGYIANYEVKKENNKSNIEVELKYINKSPVIKEIERVSKPGRRIYSKSQEMRPVRNNMGIAILSTSHGVMTGRKAKKMNVGGEILLRVW